MTCILAQCTTGVKIIETSIFCSFHVSFLNAIFSTSTTFYNNLWLYGEQKRSKEINGGGKIMI